MSSFILKTCDDIFVCSDRFVLFADLTPCISPLPHDPPVWEKTITLSIREDKEFTGEGWKTPRHGCGNFCAFGHHLNCCLESVMFHHAMLTHLCVTQCSVLGE